MEVRQRVEAALGESVREWCEEEIALRKLLQTRD
jgi:hypothetical protein